MANEKDWYGGTKLYRTGLLNFPGTSHTIYCEEYGSPYGEPVIYLHGGPGSGILSSHLRYFDPARYHIITFDQPGCGLSRPSATDDDATPALTNNTTQDIINIVCMLREELEIDGKVHIAGGSWGTTAALAYAIQYPETVQSLLLRGVFLCRRQDVDFFFQGDAAESLGRAAADLLPLNRAIPAAWLRFAASVPPALYDQAMADISRAFLLISQRQFSHPLYRKIPRETQQFAASILPKDRIDAITAIHALFSKNRAPVAGTYLTYAAAWRRFLETIPPGGRADVVKTLAGIFALPPRSPEERDRIAKAAFEVITFQNAVGGLDWDEDDVSGAGSDSFGYARILIHYMMNGGFLGGSGEANRNQNYILEHVDRLAGIPMRIVQGRFDNACGLREAQEFVDAARAAGNKDVQFVIATAGHSGGQERTRKALTEMADRLPWIVLPNGTRRYPLCEEFEDLPRLVDSQASTRAGYQYKLGL